MTEPALTPVVPAPASAVEPTSQERLEALARRLMRSQQPLPDGLHEVMTQRWSGLFE